MKIPYYVVHSFTERIFGGNPAGVCPLEQWPPDEVLQKIAFENNLAETAFFSHEASGLRLRWFAPKAEVDLCGHATLAAAFVLYECLGHEEPSVSMLAPYWGAKLGKDVLSVRQLSSRGGEMVCTVNDSRVEIAGNAALYLNGHISI